MASSPLRGLPREVGVLVAVAFAVAVGFGIVAPAIPLFARHFGVGRTAAGAVISIFAAMRLVSALGAGRLVDRLGERRVLAVGIGLVAVSSALAGLANSYVALLLLRGVGGLGSALFSISATSLLLRSVPGDKRARAAGLFQGGFLLGGITGPAFGGLITGVSIRAPFFFYAATLAVAGSIGLAALPRTAVGARPSRAAGAAPEERTTVGQALRLPAYRAALVANLADSWAALGVRSSLVPLFVGEVLGRSPLVIGLGFVVVAAVNGAVLLPAGHYADRRGRKPVLVTGCALSALGMALLAVLPNLGGYFVALAVFGLGSGLLDVAPAAVVGDVVSGRGGTVVAGFSMAGDTGSVLGPLVAGRLADSLSYGAAFGVTSGVLGLAALLAARAPETRRVPSTADGSAAAEVVAAEAAGPPTAG
ncbi:MAG: MFS transporter [Actinomycetota bacterium]|nr:MFS transporter [Actinomycetota bacterium]